MGVLCTALGVSRASAWGFFPGPSTLALQGGTLGVLWVWSCLLSVLVGATITFGVACLAPASGTCRPLEIACVFTPSSPLPEITLIELFRWAPVSGWVLASPAVLRPVCVTLI